MDDPHRAPQVGTTFVAAGCVTIGRQVNSAKVCCVFAVASHSMIVLWPSMVGQHNLTLESRQ